MAGLMAKIQQANGASRALFRHLGFAQVGEADYFGEVTVAVAWDQVGRLVEGWLDSASASLYREAEYMRQ
ncbi:hypothetical protein UVI_02044310 [Ustilaginoidea virens]|nr:hypothetical protein UVI_02044310 [Ustilaginoidea virens]